MKAKKAIRKLTRVEDILAVVIDQYSGKGDVREFLTSAVEAVGRAKKKVTVKASSKAQKKPPVKARASKSRTSVKSRKPEPTAVKKQAAAA